MRTFTCRCGNRIFFENSECLQCKRRLGFDADRLQLYALEKVTNHADLWSSVLPNGKTINFRLCKNTLDFQVCNWIIPQSSKHTYCLACRMNEMIPSLTKPENLGLWESMEISKNRLIYSLLKLGLPVTSKIESPKSGLAFSFLEDKRTNQAVAAQHVMTGHANGLITVNLNEADSAFREAQRLQLSESYRTLLGHFRHESGHYYWDRLIRDSDQLETFRDIFGDERQDYQQALADHYSHPPMQETEDYISYYAQSHPHEDWAETWAHYLHMIDTLETASVFGLLGQHDTSSKFDQMISEWSELSIMMNSLNRSMGLYDAYPFVLTDVIRTKLQFVHDLMKPTPAPTRSEVTPGKLL